MYLLFTRSNSLLSRIIRRLTGESVSHVAVQYGSEVIHSNLLGVHREYVTTFSRKSETVYSIQVTDIPEAWMMLQVHEGAGYDFGALLYLGLRSIFRCLPRKNLWQTTGMFLCTEWVSAILYGKEDSMITPYQLYLRILMENGNTYPIQEN